MRENKEKANVNKRTLQVSLYLLFFSGVSLCVKYEFVSAPHDVDSSKLKFPFSPITKTIYSLRFSKCVNVEMFDFGMSYSNTSKLIPEYEKHLGNDSDYDVHLRLVIWYKLMKLPGNFILFYSINLHFQSIFLCILDIFLESNDH